MKHPFATLLLAGILSACGDSISTNDQPVTGDHPAPAADTTAGLDTLAAPTGGAAPFVNPARAQRGRGIRHPSPPATRVR
ncbi:hypothetical protein [Hymenobacter daeguensis]